jgi:hypothetical protein
LPAEWDEALLEEYVEPAFPKSFDRILQKRPWRADGLRGVVSLRQGYVKTADRDW